MMGKTSEYRRVAFAHHGEACVACGTVENIEVHHLDGDRNNNDPDNLRPLCASCHKELHNSGLAGLEDQLKPVEDRSHIDPSTITFGMDVDDETWEEWKNTVPRSKSLETRIIELIEADTEGRVQERDADTEGNSET